MKLLTSAMHPVIYWMVFLQCMVSSMELPQRAPKSAMDHITSVFLFIYILNIFFFTNLKLPKSQH